MKSAGKARNNGLYRHIRTSKEIIRNLLNDLFNNLMVFTAGIFSHKSKAGERTVQKVRSCLRCIWGNRKWMSMNIRSLQ